MSAESSTNNGRNRWWLLPLAACLLIRAGTLFVGVDLSGWWWGKVFSKAAGVAWGVLGVGILLAVGAAAVYVRTVGIRPKATSALPFALGLIIVIAVGLIGVGVGRFVPSPWQRWVYGSGMLLESAGLVGWWVFERRHPSWGLDAGP